MKSETRSRANRARIVYTQVVMHDTRGVEMVSGIVMDILALGWFGLVLVGLGWLGLVWVGLVCFGWIWFV